LAEKKVVRNGSHSSQGGSGKSSARSDIEGPGGRGELGSSRGHLCVSFRNLVPSGNQVSSWYPIVLKPHGGDKVTIIVGRLCPSKVQRGHGRQTIILLLGEEGARCHLAAARKVVRGWLVKVGLDSIRINVRGLECKESSLRATKGERKVVGNGIHQNRRSNTPTTK